MREHSQWLCDYKDYPDMTDISQKLKHWSTEQFAKQVNCPRALVLALSSKDLTSKEQKR